MPVKRRVTVRVVQSIVLLVFALISLAGCGSTSKTTSSSQPIDQVGDDSTNLNQMGGSIQSKALSLAGTESIFAGVPLYGPDGAPTAATFNHAYGITTDGTNLYVADTYNHAIRKVDIATGTVTTLAGGAYGVRDGIGSEAGFNMPRGITTDGANLYVCDHSNNAIRKVVIATGAVTTLAGTPLTAGFSDGIGAAARFNLPTGITTDGTNLYVTELGGTVRRVNIATGAVTTLAGSNGVRGSTDGVGTAALFDQPQGITTDGTALYVADTGNGSIRKIVIATGVVTTLAGAPHEYGSTDGTVTARFNIPAGIATDGTSLYVTDNNNHNIRKVVIATGAVTTLAGSASTARGINDGIGAAAQFVYPWAIATDGTNLYVTDEGTHSIRKIEIAAAKVTTLAGSGGSVGSADGTGASAHFNEPRGITTDGTNLYVADAGNNLLRKIVIATGAVTTVAGSADQPRGLSDGIGAAARFNAPNGITTDGKNLYVADSGNHAIRKVVLATGEVTTLAGSAGEEGDSDGVGSAARFSFPIDITTDGTNLYVADFYNCVIRKVVIATGAVTTLAGRSKVTGASNGTGSEALFNPPISLTTDGTSLYVTEFSARTIRQIRIATGEVTTLAGTNGTTGSADGTGAAARFAGTYGITTDGASLYVNDGGAIRRVEIATGAVTTPPNSSFLGMFGCLTTDGTNLYATDVGRNVIMSVR